MEDADLAILIPWRGEGGGSTRLRNLNVVLNHLQQLSPSRIILCDDPNPRFNRGRALHNGLHGLHEQVLLFADADLLVDLCVLNQAIAFCRREHEHLVVPFSRVVYLAEDGTRAVIEEDATYADMLGWITPQHIELDWNRPSSGGINVVWREMYEESGGFDWRFDGWGFEDAAFSIAWETLIGPIHRMEGTAIHLWHPLSFREGPKSRIYKQNQALCRRYEKAARNGPAMRQLTAEQDL